MGTSCERQGTKPCWWSQTKMRPKGLPFPQTQIAGPAGLSPRPEEPGPERTCPPKLSFKREPACTHCASHLSTRAPSEPSSPPIYLLFPEHAVGLTSLPLPICQDPVIVVLVGALSLLPTPDRTQHPLLGACLSLDTTIACLLYQGP